MQLSQRDTEIYAEQLGFLDAVLTAKVSPVIPREVFFNFQFSKIAKTRLSHSFIFLLAIERDGIREAIKSARAMNWNLLPALYELSEEACQDNESGLCDGHQTPQESI